MDILNTAIGVILGIMGTVAYNWLRNKYVLRTEPLIALRSSSDTWNIRNRSSNRIFISSVSYDGENRSWHGVSIPEGHSFLVQGHEVTAGPIPNGVLVSIFWLEAPLLRRVRYRNGSFYAKADEAEFVVRPRELSPRGGK